MNTAQLCVVGTVATDPKQTVLSSGVHICKFRLANSERRFDRERGAWVDGETNWFTVQAFRSLAENALQSFHKGDRVVVRGRLRVKQWERDGKNGVDVEIEADSLGHDLRWGSTSFSKQSPDTRTSLEPSASAERNGEAAAIGASQADLTPAAPF